VTARLPVVVGSDGLPQQLQSGDSINMPAGSLASLAVYSTTVSSVSNAAWTSVPVDITGNTALVAGNVYIFRLTVPGTVTSAGACYQVYQTAASTWAIRLVANNGTDSNKPRLQVSSGAVQVTTNSSSAYNVQVTVETRYTGNTTLTHPAALGVDGALSHDGDAGALTTAASIVGIGAAPLAWAAGNVGVEMQGGAVMSSSTSSMQVAQNAALTSLGWTYKYAGFAGLYAMSSGGHTWSNAASGSAGAAIVWSTPMTLTSGGSLLLGKTVDSTLDKLQVAGTIGAYSAQSGGSLANFYACAGTVAAPTAILASTTLGGLTFNGYNGSNYITGAQITVGSNGAISTGSAACYMTFSTTATSSPTEAMRITSSQRVLIGSTTDNGSGSLLQVSGPAWVSNGLLMPTTTQLIPSSGGSVTFSMRFAGRAMLTCQPNMGAPVVAQASYATRKIGSWAPMNNTSGGVFTGNFPSQTSVGTPTARVVATGSIAGLATRLAYISAATAASFAGIYCATAQYTTGSGNTAQGGFMFSWRFHFGDTAAVSGARAFIGMSSTVAAPANVEPSSLIGSFGLAQLSTDSTQLYIVYGGTTAQTPIALGTGFPPMVAAGATSGPVYNFTLFCAPTSSSVVYYRLDRLDTGTFVEGSIGGSTAQILGGSTLIAPRAWRTNNATAAAVTLEVHSMYSETEA